MARRWTPPPRLQDAQLDASDPSGHAALSASAGTGKTQVLTSRVLRLMLQGAAPQTILCLTFTKAGAAEMANRIAERLSRWVRLPDLQLAEELRAIGERDDPALRRRARQLFARVLEAPGGLRIQTIHSFAQTLLSAFPVEAGISPGIRPIEGRAVTELARRTLAQLLTDAEAGLHPGLMADVQRLSLRLGEQDTIRYLMACARPRAAAAIDALGAPDGYEPRLRALVGIGEGSFEQVMEAALGDDKVCRETVERLRDAHRAWGTKTGLATAAALDAWLGSPASRISLLAGVTRGIVRGDGELCVVKPALKTAEPDYDRLARRFAEEIAAARSVEVGFHLASLQAAGLRAGARFALAYALAKRRAGVADFDDLIGWVRGLLDTPGMGEWVRYKLDQRTDHLLVDEAQDTNADQWAIVEALVGEYLTGQAEADGRCRTLFLVGDYKQAIYGFQGTDPREFERFRDRVAERAAEAHEAARESETPVTPFRDLSIEASFRSAPAVLELVDAVIAGIGSAAMGLGREAPRHVAFKRAMAGEVEWWPPTRAPGAAGEAASGGDSVAAASGAGEEGWLSDPVRHHADVIAAAVEGWLAEPFGTGSARAPLRAGDILILVRSRSELAALIVARLYARGVPVAGIDRLLLAAPLAVKDLISAIAFAVQPLDDLNLAALLVSPLIGLDHAALEALAMGRSEARLWAELRRRRAERPDWSEAHEKLLTLLAMADQVPPAAFLEQLLSGPLDGRARLVRRLGEAARDPIEELVATALDFERQEIGALDHFLGWFASGEVEVARDAEAAGGAVRVMTVHGSKGLEAPLVVLADATFDPAKTGRLPIHVETAFDGDDGAAGRVPLMRPRAAERIDPFATQMADDAARELEEHWRLLYVAMTRAAQKLVIAGVEKDRPSEASWHARVGDALVALGAADLPDRPGGLCWRGPSHTPLPPPGTARARRGGGSALPEWVRRPAPAEARPPRPLAPSALVADDEARPPPGPALRAAARRGTLMHLLFERLAGTPASERAPLADRFLARNGIAEPAERTAIWGAVAAVMDDPRFAELFGPDAFAEAPIAATLADGRVVAGTIDLLHVTDRKVRVIDFKTGARVPASLAEVPAGHRAQMDAYAEAAGIIFPGRTVEAALLYTAGPTLIAVSP